MGWLALLRQGIGAGFRPGSGAATLYVILFLAFCAVGAVLMLLGFDLDAVDRGLDAHADLLDRIGTLIFKAVLGLILLLCTFMVGGGLYQYFRPAPKTGRIGWGAILVALVIGYFCWAGIAAPL